jgi:hypothetical protein
MIKWIHYSVVFITGLLLQQESYAQTIPIGETAMDEELRNLQLLQQFNPQYSFNARPFFTTSAFTRDSLIQRIHPTENPQTTTAGFLNGKGRFELFPLYLNSRYNSHHPYGWNNPGMIDAKGIQATVSTGFYAATGPFSLQVLPMIAYAANPQFEYNSQYGAPTKGAYKKLFPGQSSFRINIKNISLGISTENLWWGPGIHNSLLMSNNAPGFAHLTLNSTAPLKTPIGSFEFQLIAGKLTEDTTVLLENKDLTTAYYAQNSYFGLPANPQLDSLSWRYLNGLTISYQPKWVPHLFIGFSRVGYTYHQYIGEHHGFIHNYLPVFVGLFRSSGTYANGSQHLKQILSLSARYVLPKAHAEIYGEYGFDDNAQDQRDLLQSANHGAAYTVGFKKLFVLTNQSKVDFNAEFTQLEQPVDYMVRSTGYWYLYNGGYTQQGRIIGSGFGMGSNMQTIQVSYLATKVNKLGLSFQKIIHDPLPDYIINGVPTATGLPSTNIGIRDIRWKDVVIGLQYSQRIVNFLLNTQINMVQSQNYAWMKDQNRTNIYAGINLVYYW